MRHGLVAFGITTAVLVPAALDRLDAGSAQVAMLVAPGARTVELGGIAIDVGLDRAIVEAGGTLRITLTAFGAVERKVTVAVLVMESVGSADSRVETPPNRVARELVTFAPGTTDTIRTVDVVLRGQAPSSVMDGAPPFGRYTVLVMAPAAADRLEKLRRRAVRVADPMEDDGGRYGTWSRAYDGIGRELDDLSGDDELAADEAALARVIGAPNETARLDVVTRPRGGTVDVRVPDTATVGTPYPVTVTVRNPGQDTLDHVVVSLGQPPLYGFELAGLTDRQLTFAPDSATIELGPRETKQVTFQVTASAAGVAGLYASTTCDEDTDWDACAPIIGGQLDATEIVAPTEPAAAAPTTIAAAAPAPTTATPPTTATTAVATAPAPTTLAAAVAP
jgi:hypothetical protein